MGGRDAGGAAADVERAHLPLSAIRQTLPRLESEVYIAPSGPATISFGTANSARSGISETRGEACAAVRKR